MRSVSSTRRRSRLTCATARRAARALELKALTVGGSDGGGYTVPAEVEQAIGQRLTAISPIRGIAGVRTISGNVYKKPFMTAGPSVGWVGETDARAQTTAPDA